MIQTARLGSYQGGKGYLRQETLDGRVFEYDTLTCNHCSAVRIKNPARTRPRGRCIRCSRYICDVCDRIQQTQSGDHCHNTQEMIDLALAFPAHGPFLTRGPTGEPLYDIRIRDQRRLW